MARGLGLPDGMDFLRMRIWVDELSTECHGGWGDCDAQRMQVARKKADKAMESS
jgi:arabinogalactan endo-1,4-beta-galactosidase